MVFWLTWLGTDSELTEPRPPLTGNRSLVNLLLSFDFVLISRPSPLTSLFYEWGPDSQAWTSKTTVFFVLHLGFLMNFWGWNQKILLMFSYNQTLSKRAECINIQHKLGSTWWQLNLPSVDAITVCSAACFVHLLLWRSLADKSYETAKSISLILIWLCIVKKILILVSWITLMLLAH